MGNVTNVPDACSTSTPLLRAEIRGAFTLITGKWKLEILWLLNQRIHRFGELKRSIPGITQHMLTTQLRELEADSLISRTLFAEVPPRAEYALTDSRGARHSSAGAALRRARRRRRSHGISSEPDG